MDLAITLTFSIVMLVFMVYPAMKIVDWIRSKTQLSEKSYDILQISTTVFLSLLIGLFLKFA